MRAAAVIVGGGLFMLAVGAMAATRANDPARGAPLVAPEAFLTLWLLSLPVGVMLLGIHWLVGRLRLRRFERRAGFLPRVGRKALPATGRTTLFRVEYGSRGERVCLIVARWDYDASSGWKRARVVEHAWHPADDAVALGEERTRLTALAEELEEEIDDVRLEGQGERSLANEVLAECRALRKHSHQLAQSLARDDR